MKHKTLKIVVLAITSVILLGCSSRAILQDANKSADNNSTNIQQLKAIDNSTPPPVVSKDGFFSDKNPISLENRPLWLKNPISISGNRLPLSFVMQRILHNTDVLVKYQTGVRKEKLISIDYSGTVKGALDQLATQINYTYDPTDNDITWEAFVTKTFNISFMPGASTYQVGQTSASSSSSSSSSSGNSGVTAQTGTLFGNDQQFSGLQASSLSVWKDLKSTLDQLKSPEGKISVSEATTMVTVYDRPTNVEAIGRYVDQLNKSLSKQVRLKVQVLEVDLDKEHTLGIDWNLAQHWLGQNINIAGKLGEAANIGAGIGAGALSSASSPVQFKIGPNSNGGTFAIQALSTQGKVSVVTEPTVMAMNNQVAEVRASRNTGYLQSVQTTAGQGLSNTASTTLTPGVVTDGVILYLLPKIKDGQVYLQVSSIISDLASMNTINSSGGHDTQTAAGSPLNAIQTPTVNEKRFNIRSVVENDSTLIIGGFKQVHDTTRENKMLGLKALGGEGAQTINSETVILITPTIIEN